MSDDRTPDATGTAPTQPRDWMAVLARYRQPSNARGLLEIAITLVPFAVLCVLMWFALEHNYWPVVVLAIPAGALLVRLFLIQHDCGHGAFFRQRFANDWTGRVIGVLTLTPYGFWRRTHALHHAGSGCLDKRGYGDLDTLTVAEYRALKPFARLRYRLYRHPIVMFGLGPAYMFLLRHRFPAGLIGGSWGEWISAMGTNLGIAVLVAAIIWGVGLKTLFLVYLPIVLIAGSIGIWLFFVQHQFEDTTWDEKGDWDWHAAALHGSSHYDLPGFLRWLTANIGIHHVHHLCSRIPYYRLPAVLRDYPELRNVSRLTLVESLSCVRLTLWDEAERRLVSFAEAG